MENTSAAGSVCPMQFIYIIQLLNQRQNCVTQKKKKDQGKQKLQNGETKRECLPRVVAAVAFLIWKMAFHE